ncbi:MAG: winged helix-turn-helix domain-containing protein [Desulfobacterium sp.]
MIPDLQKIMLPVLQILGDKNEKNVSDIRAHIASTFQVTEEEQRQKTPSGKQNLFYNRVAWSVAYLKMANLIYSEQRSIYEVIQEGLELLQKKPESISVKLLKSIPEFREKVSPNKKQDPILEDDPVESNAPDELIEIGYNKIREELVNQLLDMIKANSPSFFENLVIDRKYSVSF